MRTKYPKGSDGYYRAKFTYNGVSCDLRAKDVRTLDEKVYARKQEIDRGDSIDSPHVTVATWAAEWLEVYKRPSVVEKSYNTYKSNIEKYILPEIGKLKLTEVRPIHLQKILQSQAGRSKSHVSHVKNAITSIFRQARINRYIMEDPSEHLTLPQTTEGTHRSLTVVERRVLLEVCKEHYAGVWALMIYYCGIRPGETSALLCKHIDLSAKMIHVIEATKSGTRITGTTKTKAGVRDVPIPDDYYPIIAAHIASKQPNDYVFTLSNGNRCRDDSLCRWWNSIERAMDIYMGAIVKRNKIIEHKLAQDLTTYCLRHTYCTNLQRAGVPLNVAKYLMGHDDVKMTANIYGHQTDDQTEAARNSINQLMKNDAKSGSCGGSKKYKLRRVI